MSDKIQTETAGQRRTAAARAARRRKAREREEAAAIALLTERGWCLAGAIPPGTQR